MSTTRNSGWLPASPSPSSGDALPALSVVIASLDPGPVVFDCLARLERQANDALEILVVDGSRDDTAAQIRARFPRVRVFDAPAPRSVPHLRGIGLAEAAAPLVGILDPHCLVGDGWVAEAIRVHRDRSEPAAAGPVMLDGSQRRELAAWVGYLFDYWEFVPPVAEGLATVLPGNNIVYKREALPDADTLRRHGFWKAFTNAGLQAAGKQLWMSPALTVQLRRRLSAAEFVRSRWHYGRSYAAMRTEGAPLAVRLLRAMGAPLLPLVFLARQGRGLVRKSGHRAWFLASLPLLAVCHVSWAVGELCGYLFGPGRSHDAIRS